MRRLLWQIIEESKENKEYLNSEKQYNNLIQIISRYPKGTRKKLEDQWFQELQIIIKDRIKEFDKLHVQRGGIINAGDDGFYCDFAAWMMAQGEQLYNAFLKDGHQAVLEYISKHGVSESDYLFESMTYAFIKTC
ncbi:DUF4240 domain-containing protein [Paenibacillus polymyxa]|uniref:DUF4240 domain-containing protein n=1 Tax=Paenibacillus polymyxa TaxID=1406 RepID=UPI0025B72A0C|nr:DUF4240 domain-containing protein [Paenibacillus polymyxa]MDN4090926.1 DUF4240 domain-containing protein [Paenibacillus polymyxa]